MTSQGGSVIGPRLKRGLGYLALGSDGGALAFLRSLQTLGEPFLWITHLPDEAPAGGEVLRVTPLGHGPGAVDPKRAGDLRTAVSEFLRARDEGTVVVDCVELLTTHNGVERTVRTLEDLHEEVATRAATLVVFLDPRRANPRAKAWLEREFDPLPFDAQAGALEDRLVA